MGTTYITETTILLAKLRAGQRPTIRLPRDKAERVHTTERPHCSDPECPCNLVCPDEPSHREFMDILNPVAADDESFEDGMGTGYLSFYDANDPRACPASCTDLLAFLRETHSPDHDETWNRGYVCGYLIAMGERNPRFEWASVPPVK